jgi:thiol-disulfide isomerase/thioredoxin
VRKSSATRDHLPNPNIGKLAVLLSLLCAQPGCGQPLPGVPRIQKADHRKILEMVSQNHGNVTLVNVWATWCDPCREEMPNLVKLRNNYRDRGLEVIIVSADDIDKADSLVPATLKKLGVDFQTYIDQDSTDDAFINGMDPQWSGALPTSFLYGKDGKLVETMLGGKSYEAFEKEVTKLLK